MEGNVKKALKVMLDFSLYNSIYINMQEFLGISNMAYVYYWLEYKEKACLVCCNSTTLRVYAWWLHLASIMDFLSDKLMNVYF